MKVAFPVKQMINGKYQYVFALIVVDSIGIEEESKPAYLTEFSIFAHVIHSPQLF